MEELKVAAAALDINLKFELDYLCKDKDVDAFDQI